MSRKVSKHATLHLQQGMGSVLMLVVFCWPVLSALCFVIAETFAVVSWPNEDDGSAVSVITPHHRVTGKLAVGELCKVTIGNKQYEACVHATGLCL